MTLGSSEYVTCVTYSFIIIDLKKLKIMKEGLKKYKIV